MASILAVDDSQSILDMVVYTLESAGHEVAQARNGAEGLEAAKGARFDLVLTDVNMPVMGGIELVRELRALPEFKYTPILVLTTESGANKKDEGRQAGATGWLVKPFNPEQLLATLERVL